MSKYQTFEMKKLKRNEIQEAYYNPRKIKEDNLKKLKNKIKDEAFGLVQPLIINKRTGNLVSGHQRLKVLDQLEKNTDYSIDCAIIDVDEKKEVEINIFLNNQSAMGEWDIDCLKELNITYPDVDFIKDLGFDKLDLDFFEIDTHEPKKELTPEQKIEQSDNMRRIKEESKEKKKQQAVENGGGNYGEQNNYYLTIVFNTNIDKENFCSKIGVEKKEKYIKASKLFDILPEEFKF